MINLPDKAISYWKSSAPKTTYKPLSTDIEVDAVVVGGGIAGLSAAYLLKQAGQTVAVLEKNTLASGTTSGTTGKVTSQHGLNYAELQKHSGQEAAKVYADANQTALEQIAQIIAKEKIDCEWVRDDNYVYTAELSQIQKFKAEAKTAAGLGLPATFETKLELPFKVAAAVKFANQAKMHAPKYVQGLAAAVHGQGSYVCEHSNVISFNDGEPASVRTKQGTVTAKNIIVATKMPAFPLVARFSIAAQEYPHTSYIVAGLFAGSLRGMYISPDKGHYSILPVTAGKERLLLIGGERHIPGLGSPHKRQQRLANYAHKHFGVTNIDYAWKAMDYLAYDDVPLIGKVYPWSKHLYTATGFKKWGLSTSVVAGIILRDTIMGQQNPWASTFNSQRLKPVTSMPRAMTKYLSAKFR